MKAYFELKERLCSEIEEMAGKQKLTMSDLEILHKVTDTIKNIDKILMMEDRDISENSRGYSGRGASYDDDMSMRSYDSGNSYARSYDMSRDGDYSQRRNYSRDSGREHMIQKLRSMMHDAGGEKEREAIRKCMTQLENV